MKGLFLPLFLLALLAASCQDNAADLRHQAQVEALMQQFSVREKVAQLFVITISREPSEETVARQDSLIRDYGVGGAIIMRGPVRPFIERMNRLQSMASLPLLVATDAEWGAAMRFAEYLPYPRQRLLGRLEGRGGLKLIYRMGRNVGRELRDLGIYVNYAPVADACPDMVLMPDDEMLSIDAIADSVSCGAWPMEELDAKVRRVLMLKARAGFFDEGFDPQVRDLDSKIAEARRRDSLLQLRITRALSRSSKPYIEPVYGDKTLVLDKAGR